jgi:seryl-tRNA synthetase
VIDIKLLRDNPDLVKASQRVRGEDESVVDQILAADESRRASLTEFEQARAEQKAIGKDVARAQGEEKQAIRGRVKDLAARVKELDAAAGAAQAELDTLMTRIGNVVEEGVPAGGEDDFVVLETVGTPRDFAAEGFEPKDHLERSTWTVVPRSPAPASTSSRAWARAWRWRCSTSRCSAPSRPASPP